MTKAIVLPLTENEIKTVEKKVLDDLSVYINRIIKDELQKIFLAKKKVFSESQFSFI